MNTFACWLSFWRTHLWFSFRSLSVPYIEGQRHSSHIPHGLEGVTSQSSMALTSHLSLTSASEAVSESDAVSESASVQDRAKVWFCEEKLSWSEPELFLNPPPLLATFLFGYENSATQLFLDPSFLPVNLPGGRGFLKGSFTEVSEVQTWELCLWVPHFKHKSNLFTVTVKSQKIRPAWYSVLVYFIHN